MIIGSFINEEDGCIIYKGLVMAKFNPKMRSLFAVDDDDVDDVDHSVINVTFCCHYLIRLTFL